MRDSMVARNRERTRADPEPISPLDVKATSVQVYAVSAGGNIKLVSFYNKPWLVDRRIAPLDGNDLDGI